MTSFGRAIALCLLFWTAVDLANASACALDNESVASGTAAAIYPQAPSTGGRAPAAHVDDCFCCSHCVDVERPASPAAARRVTPRFEALPRPFPHLLAASLFHPPQASLL